MQVFKYYFKILKDYKGFIILYTILLLVFGILNVSTNEQSIGFESVKPSIAIVNNDEMTGITKDFYDYIDKNTNIVKLDNDQIADSLFAREISLVITIPQNFNNDFMNNLNPLVEINSTGNYSSTYAQMLIDKYFNIASSYLEYYPKENELITKINDTLKTNTEIEIASKLDSTSLNKV